VTKVLTIRNKGKRGRPRETPAPFRYRWLSYVRRGDQLRREDQDYIRATFAVPPPLRKSWWICNHDGSLDKRAKKWFNATQAVEWRRFVEDDVDRSLNR